MFWLVFGLFGQFIFSCRFIVQWIMSERAKKSIIPVVFWYLSILGSLVLLIYAIHKKDLVFILGQASGFIVYLRNIVLIFRERKAQNAD